MKIIFMWPLLILVVSTVGFLVTMPNVDSHGYWLGKSKSDIRMLSDAVNEFLHDHKQLPSVAEGLISLVNTAGNKNIYDRKHYLSRLPRDYWGNDYIYRVIEEGTKFEIYSAGPDAVDNDMMGDDVVIGDKHYSCELYNDCLTLMDYVYRGCIAIMIISVTLILVFIARTGTLTK
jgi:general secretion pathway protein G